ncbi:MAG: ABC transporter substrate-binding protein [Trueperaceae bacterium]
MKKLFILAALLATTAFAQEKATLVLNWFPETGHAGYYAAAQDGLYTAKGIEVEIQPGGPDTIGATLLATGRAQFAMLGATELLLAREQGIPLVAIFGAFQDNPQALMYHAENPIDSFEDLEGRSVAISPGAPYWDFIQKKYNLEGKVQVVNYSGGLADWARDPMAITQIYITAEPYSADKEGLANGSLMVLDSGYNPYGDIIVTTEEFLASNPDAVKAFVEASQEGYKAFFADPAKYAPALEAANSENTEDVVLWGAEAIKALIDTGDATTLGIGAMTEERWQTVYDQLKEVGVLKAATDIDVTQVFNASFVPTP